MKAALQEYCREVDERAERFATETEMRERADHLNAFNLGRLAQRVDGWKFGGLLRAAWLVVGMLIGMNIGWALLPFLQAATSKKFFTRSASALQTAGSPALHHEPR